ncbi:hypothetical protein AB0B56_42825, partial [Streptosporangium canum]|uniref:hypothetical protein n=1 Tax=Streptosporangium canum TaxID=324952 RepID=UPI003438C9C0
DKRGTPTMGGTVIVIAALLGFARAPASRACGLGAGPGRRRDFGPPADHRTRRTQRTRRSQHRAAAPQLSRRPES